MNKYIKHSFFLSALIVITYLASHYFTNKTIFLAQLEKNNLKDHPAYEEYLESLTARKERKEMKGEANGMRRYFYDLRANQNTGIFSTQDVLKAREAVRQRMTQNASGTRKAASAVNLTWEEMGPDNIGGRSRGVLIDINNPNRVYASSVTGGLFVSNNGGVSWAPHPFNNGPFYPGIGSIAQASNGDIYLGTGEGFGFGQNGVVVNSFSAPTFIGSGMFKSTDGGQTFNLLPSTLPQSNVNNDPWVVVNEIAIDPNNSSRIYAATFGGVKISSDGGVSWTDASGLLPVDFDKPATDVHVGSNGIVHAFINNKYYNSFDGFNYANMMGVGGFPQNLSRSEFALSPTDPNYVYVLASRGGATDGVYRSTDGGFSWEQMIAGDATLFNPLGAGQASWNNTIAVDPSNKDRIFLAGQLEVWSFSPADGWNIVAFWQPKSPANPFYVHADNHDIEFSKSNPNIMFIANDGGVFQTTEAQVRFPRFIERNKGLNTIQFYSFGTGLDGTMIGGAQDNGTMVIPFNLNTTLSADFVQGGDGGKSEISKINPLAMFASLPGGSLTRSSNGGASFGSYFDDRVDPDADGGSSSSFFMPEFILWEQVVNNSFEYPEDIITNGNTTIITRTKKTDVTQKSVILMENGGRLWITPDALDFSGQPRWFPVPNGANTSTIEAHEDGTVYYGTTNSQLFRLEGLANKYRLDTINTIVTNDTVVNGQNTIITISIDSVYRNVPDYPVNSLPVNWNWTSVNVSNFQGLTNKRIADGADFGGNGRWVNGIAIDPNNKEHIIATLGQYGNSNYVFEATDAFSNDNPILTSIQNDLPAFPVYDAVIDYYNSSNIILGTDVGLWTSSNGGANWEFSETEFTHVPVLELRQDKMYFDGCFVIYAGTHGRGIFRTFSPDHPGDGVCPKTPGLITSVKETGKAIEVSSKFYPNPVIGNEATLEISTNATSGLSIQLIDFLGRTYSQSALQTQLNKGNNTVKVNFSGVPTGNYILSIKTEGKTTTKNVVVVK